MASAEPTKMTMLKKRCSNLKLMSLVTGLAITLAALAAPSFGKPRPLGQLPPPGSLPAGQLPPGSGYLPAGYLPGSIGTTTAKPKHTHKPKAKHHHTTHAATYTTIILPRSVVHTHTTLTRTITRTEIIVVPAAPNAVAAPPVVIAKPPVVASAVTPPLSPVYSSGPAPLAFSPLTVKKSLTIPQVAGLAPGNTPHSIAAWVKATNLPTNGREWILLLGNGGPYSLAHHWILHPDGRLQIGAWGGKGVTGYMKPGVWTHIATSFDGTTMNLYINGALVGSSQPKFNLQGIPFSIARRHTGGSPHEHDFRGEFCGVSVFNRALSLAEVAAVSQATQPTTTLPQATLSQATSLP